MQAGEDGRRVAGTESAADLHHFVVLLWAAGIPWAPLRGCPRLLTLTASPSRGPTLALTRALTRALTQD
jgi:hypothetical protein